MVPLLNIDHAIAELSGAIGDAGLMARLSLSRRRPSYPTPIRTHERFWAAAQEMDMPLSRCITMPR